MSKAPRFPRQLACWVSDEFADAIEMIADARVTTSSHIMREALAIYLQQFGALAPRPKSNGAADAQAVGHGL